MKKPHYSLVKVLVCFMSIIQLLSCSGNGGANKTTLADTAKSKIPKLSAKERLIKNNILEWHTNWTTMYLKGKVKTCIKITKELTANGKLIIRGTKVDSYDVRGNKVLTIEYDANGNMEAKDSMLYDANDNIISGYSLEKNKLTLTTESKYDNRGNEIAFTIYHKGAVYSVDSYKYDDEDNLVEIDFGSNWLRGTKWVFKYDEHGFSIASEQFDSTGKPGMKSAGVRDEKGNSLYGVTYNADGSIYGTDSMRYDDKGNRMVIAVYNADGSLKNKTTYKYDDKGNKTEIINYIKDRSADRVLSSFYTYIYDATGNITRQTLLEKEGEKTTTEIREFAYTYY